MGYGLGSFGVETAFPIATNVLLRLWDRRFVPTVPPRLSEIPLTKEDVAFYNSLQVEQSQQYLYCRFSDFSLAEKQCGERPDICVPGRQRVYAN
jgi:hypothetical protein